MAFLRNLPHHIWARISQFVDNRACKTYPNHDLKLTDYSTAFFAGLKAFDKVCVSATQVQLLKEEFAYLIEKRKEEQPTLRVLEIRIALIDNLFDLNWLLQRVWHEWEGFGQLQVLSLRFGYKPLKTTKGPQEGIQLDVAPLHNLFYLKVRTTCSSNLVFLPDRETLQGHPLTIQIPQTLQVLYIENIKMLQGMSDNILQSLLQLRALRLSAEINKPAVTLSALAKLRLEALCCSCIRERQVIQLKHQFKELIAYGRFSRKLIKFDKWVARQPFMRSINS